MSLLLSEKPLIPSIKTFRRGRWDKTVDVKDFIDRNITPYDGNATFLSAPSERTRALWERCLEFIAKEIAAGGVLDVDTRTISSVTSHAAGYIDRDNELIVGLQTDAPLKRAVKPYGGIRMVKQALADYGYELDSAVEDVFQKYRKTHNDAVFQGYTADMIRARKHGYITGLPDTYARGRIIGDYRRVALYGIDFLVEQKKIDLISLEEYPFSEEIVRLREEVHEQLTALADIKTMAASYGYDIANHAMNAREAIQWTYFAFLAAIKEHDGAAMSMGSVTAFFDIFIERDMKRGTLTEVEAQELIDDFVIKLRLVRHLRPKAYNDIFAGDPTWVTESIGGMLDDGRHKITKSAYRMLHTLSNLGPSPEPNLTVLWSHRLPDNFKRFAAQVAAMTSSVQFENDDLMRPLAGDDYGVSCCVSLQGLSSSIQYFGARCNIAKALLLALNAGREEFSGETVIEGITPLPDGPLNIEDVKSRFYMVIKWLAKLYVETMNVIHYMHDKYYYERSQMALLDSFVSRTMAFGLAGLSGAADSLSAIRYAKITAIRDENGLTTAFTVEGSYPKYGNDDDRADGRAVDVVKVFHDEISRHTIYRSAKPTLSILTITSNVMYGKKTGATPDGRPAEAPFAPGANPMHGRDENGALASLNSVAKIPYSLCLDGVSNTFSVIPSVLGSNDSMRVGNLITLLDGYFIKGGHHLNVNVIDRKTLTDAIAHPEKYPQLTIRVSGYAVHFIKLSREQQMEVLARTFHESLA